MGIQSGLIISQIGYVSRFMTCRYCYITDFIYYQWEKLVSNNNKRLGRQLIQNVIM